MKLLLTKGISFGSVLLGIIIILFFGVRNGLSGAGWTLLILGSPTTFFNLLLNMINRNFLFDFISVFTLYILQYQVIAFLVYKFYSRFITVLLLCLIIIIPSAYAMWHVCVGRYSAKQDHPIYGTQEIKN